RDLHIRDIVAVPDRLKKSVGKAEIQQILDRFLAEEMIDAADSRFGEELVDRTVQRLRGYKVAAEGFFDNDASSFCAARFGQTFCYGCKHAWRYREIMQWPLSITEHLAESHVRGLIPVISIDVLQTRRKFSESVDLKPAMLLDTFASAIFQLIQIPTGLCHSDDRHIKVTTLDHCL